MKIAIIGSGISGLTCAYLLSKRRQVTIFEKSDYVGGHTHTVNFDINRENYAIDTGFVAFNDQAYPYFSQLLDELKIETQDIQTSFSVNHEKSSLCYNSNHLNGLFAMRRNIINPRFLKMLRDMRRFNKRALKDLFDQNIPDDLTIGEYLKACRLSLWFRERYLLPIASAVWCVSVEKILQFPAKFFITFFYNQGLLKHENLPQWKTIKGGAKTYVDKLQSYFSDNIRLDTEVLGVERLSNEVKLTHSKGVEHFDYVVFACHGNEVLKMLKDPTEVETQILSNMAYEENELVLHTDTSLLPRLKRVWASWNASITSKPENICITYYLNNLQMIQSDIHFCLTVNPTKKIDEKKVLGRYRYAHPFYTVDMIESQKRLTEISGVNLSFYCGAYWGNASHEAGIESALQVCQLLGEEWIPE